MILHIKCASCLVYIFKGDVCGYCGACVPGHVRPEMMWVCLTRTLGPSNASIGTNSSDVCDTTMHIGAHCALGNTRNEAAANPYAWSSLALGDRGRSRGIPFMSRALAA